MDVHRLGTAVRVDCPAKVNLFLEVLAKRTDGFHEIETLMTAISIYDSLWVTENSEGGIQVGCSWAFGMEAQRLRDARCGLTALPPQSENLVYKAAERLRWRAGWEGGATIQLVKRIPAEAGLGGASSDAAAAILALNHFWQLQWSRDRLAQVASELGSDIPFFLLERRTGTMAALCQGRGERITQIAGVPRWPLVVVKPAEGLSTAAVYRQCVIPEAPQASTRMLAALQSRRVVEVGSALFNRLQEAAEKLSPHVKALRHKCEQLEVVGHAMSGSGSSYFAVCHSVTQARHLAARFRAERLGQVFLASTI